MRLGSYTDELAATRKAFYLWQQAQKRLFEAKEDAKKLADEAERLAWVHEELSANSTDQGRMGRA